MTAPSRGRWLDVLLLAVLYHAAARLGLLLAFEGSNASPVWPPSGLALAAVAGRGRHMLWGVALGAFSANAAAFAANGAPLPVVLGASLVIMLGNCLEAGLGAALLRRWVGARSPFERLDDVGKFIAIAPLSSLSSATVGTATLLACGVIPAAATATVGVTWWVGDTAGILVLAPLLMALRDRPAWTSRAALPIAALLAGLALLGALIFIVPGSAALADRRSVWLFMPAIAWAAYRHGPLGVAAASLLTTGLAVWGTTRGLGPFARGNLNDALIVLQTFVALTAVTGLVLAADRRERQQMGRQGKVRRDLALPWAVLLGSLGVAMTGWHLIASDTERRAMERFHFVTNEIHDRIVNAMRVNELILRGAAGLFAGSDEVSRREWHDYVEQLALARNFPGIQAVAFARVLEPETREAYLREVRADGFPHFDIHPPGARQTYAAITYIEPFDARNQRAFGFDLLSEPVRRTALLQARDTGLPVLTGRITLLQEDSGRPQHGVLLLQPVFRNGKATDTVEKRREQLVGYVYSPLRMGNLMASALGAVPGEAGIAVRVFSGRPEAGQLLYDSGGEAASVTTPFMAARVIGLPGADWTLQTAGLPKFEAGIDLQKAQIVVIAGVGLSLLLFALVRTLTMTRERALMLAEDMNIAVRDSQTQFRSLAESASEAIVIADADGRVCSWNRAAQAIFGYSEEQMLGQSLSKLMPERFREAHQQGLARIKAGGPAHVLGRTVQLEGLRADGHVFPIELSLSTWESAAGRFYSGIIRDITDRKAADAELAAKTAALERSNEELAQYAYVASHDLKEPLRTVVSYSQLLLRRHRDRLDQEGLEFLQLIDEGARRSQALVSDLLALARVDSSAAPLQPVALQEVLDEARGQLDVALREADAELTAEALPRVLGDRAQLLQLLRNLIENAVKFRRAGVPVRVHVSAQPEKAGFWRIAVADNGIGIDPRFHDQVFTIFKRLHRAEFAGTGIGLAICKKVVERHGGRIGVESQPGRGSTLFFIIPAADTERPAAHAGSSNK